MTEITVRWTHKLLGSFLCNLAYYKAGWNDKNFICTNSNFLISANNNFLDIAVLDWCKLFADKKGDHYWGRATNNPDILSNFLQSIGISEEEFLRYETDIRAYRDQYVAHLDKKLNVYVPILGPVAFEIARYYYWYNRERYPDIFNSSKSFEDHYQDRFDEARLIYRNLGSGHSILIPNSRS